MVSAATPPRVYREMGTPGAIHAAGTPISYLPAPGSPSCSSGTPTPRVAPQGAAPDAGVWAGVSSSGRATRLRWQGPTVGASWHGERLPERPTAPRTSLGQDSCCPSGTTGECSHLSHGGTGRTARPTSALLPGASDTAATAGGVPELFGHPVRMWRPPSLGRDGRSQERRQFACDERPFHIRSPSYRARDPPVHVGMVVQSTFRRVATSKS